MKKAFFLDFILLIISIFAFVLFFKDINDFNIIIIFVLFITVSIFVSRKMSIITKLPPLNHLSLKEKLNVFLLILGKIDFLLMIIRFGYFHSKMNDSLMLLLFIVFEFLILDYAYIHNNSLIILKKDPINISLITVKESHKYYGQNYIYSYTSTHKKLNFNLSDPEFEIFNSIMRNRIMDSTSWKEHNWDSCRGFMSNNGKHRPFLSNILKKKNAISQMIPMKLRGQIP